MRTNATFARLTALATCLPSVAYAQESTTASAQSGLLGMVPFALMFVVIYVLMVRPAQKQRKQQDDMLASLKRDDEVVTQSGLIGRIVSIEEKIVTLELTDKVKVRMLRDRISGLWETKTPSPRWTNKSQPKQAAS